jgi:hypothetical protein
LKSFLIKYFFNICIMLSQMGNCLLLAGNPDQTISSRCWSNKDEPVWKQIRIAIDIIFFFHQNHCQNSHARDVENSLKLLKTGKY